MSSVTQFPRQPKDPSKTTDAAQVVTHVPAPRIDQSNGLGDRSDLQNRTSQPALYSFSELIGLRDRADVKPRTSQSTAQKAEMILPGTESFKVRWVPLHMTTKCPVTGKLIRSSHLWAVVMRSKDRKTSWDQLQQEGPGQQGLTLGLKIGRL